MKVGSGLFFSKILLHLAFFCFALRSLVSTQYQIKSFPLQSVLVSEGLVKIARASVSRFSSFFLFFLSAVAFYFGSPYSHFNSFESIICI